MTETLRQLRGKTLWAALATLIDGEGCIGIVRQGTHYGVHITVANTCQEWMVAWKERVGKGQLYTTQTEWSKPATHWKLTNRADIIYILKRIRPYLFVKAEQAALVISFFDDKLTTKVTHLGELELARRNAIYERMRILNAKGIRRDYTPSIPVGDSDIVRPTEPSVELGDNVLVQ